MTVARENVPIPQAMVFAGGSQERLHECVDVSSTHLQTLLYWNLTHKSNKEGKSIWGTATDGGGWFVSPNYRHSEHLSELASLHSVYSPWREIDTFGAWFVCFIWDYIYTAVRWDSCWKYQFLSIAYKRTLSWLTNINLNAG